MLMAAMPEDHVGAPHQSSAYAAEHPARSDIMSLLQDALAARPRDAPTIVVLHGRHGTGKRSAARHWAAKSTSDYPGGPLHVDYAEQRRTQGGAAVSDVLTECLRTLGTPPSTIPRSWERRAKLFRATTADDPVLVMLDEVTEPAQLRMLIPTAPGSVVIATTRAPLSELTLDQAQLIIVPPMPQPASLALLRAKWGAQRIDSEQDAAAQLVDWCAGLPIALNIAAATLHTHPDLPIAALKSELVNEHLHRPTVPLGADPWVFAVCTVACAKLPQKAAALYSRLGTIVERRRSLRFS